MESTLRWSTVEIEPFSNGRADLAERSGGRRDFFFFFFFFFSGKAASSAGFGGFSLGISGAPSDEILSRIVDDVALESEANYVLF